jgi:hypothetical protein
MFIQFAHLHRLPILKIKNLYLIAFKYQACSITV